jgi:hypothetical protein
VNKSKTQLPFMLKLRRRMDLFSESFGEDQKKAINEIFDHMSNLTGKDKRLYIHNKVEQELARKLYHIFRLFKNGRVDNFGILNLFHRYSSWKGKLTNFFYETGYLTFEPLAKLILQEEGFFEELRDRCQGDRASFLYKSEGRIYIDLKTLRRIKAPSLVGHRSSVNLREVESWCTDWSEDACSEVSSFRPSCR